MRILSKIHKALKSFIDYIWIIRINHYNTKALKNRLKKLPQPELTAEEKREIDSFWKQYGIRFKNYTSFQWYYGFTGIKSPKFMPLHIHKRILLKYYNSRHGNAFYRAYSDKNLFYNYFPEMPFPQPILKNIDGIFYDRFDNIVSDKDVLIRQLLSSGFDAAIVKKSVGTSQGNTVKKYSLKDTEDAKVLLDDWKNETNYVVQEAIKQHPFFARFNESSVNVIRINSVCINGKTEITTAMLRFGYPGWVTDVSHIDGKEDVRGLNISIDGYIADEAVSLQGKKWKLSDLVEDPENKKVPAWDEIAAIVKENAPKLKHIGIIGWDFAVREDGKPVVIEYNLGNPGLAFTHLTSGPFYGEQTETVLEFLKNEENQKKYIARWLRA